MLAKAIELGEHAVEAPATAFVHLYQWVTLGTEPKARAMAAMRAFDLPRDSARITRDAIDWWVRREEAIVPPVIKLAKARKASDLDELLEFCDDRCKSLVKSLAAVVPLSTAQSTVMGTDPPGNPLSVTGRAIVPPSFTVTGAAPRLASGRDGVPSSSLM